MVGVGDYTTRAVACFGSISRVLIRLFSLKNPTQKELLARSQELLNHKDAFNHNQALIDLGALLCSSKNPHCPPCPFYEFCQGSIAPQNYTQNKKIHYEKLKLHLFILEFYDKFALLKSKEKLHQGPYNFPFYPSKNMQFVAIFKHHHTKFKLELEIYHQILEKRTRTFIFKSYEEYENLALSSLSLKLFRKKNCGL